MSGIGVLVGNFPVFRRTVFQALQFYWTGICRKYKPIASAIYGVKTGNLGLYPLYKSMKSVTCHTDILVS
jgi:hypothetical protein